MKWFGRRHSPTDLMHMTLGLVGEAGEVAGDVKKWDRGDFALTLDKRMKIGLEVIDVLVYACNIFSILGIEPDDLWQHKREFNDKRFTARNNGTEDAERGTSTSDG
jgi:NTP pyrophosphatase (non-canonical NTP hydrolase)